jgi:hypothetical protein
MFKEQFEMLKNMTPEDQEMLAAQNRAHFKAALSWSSIKRETLIPLGWGLMIAATVLCLLVAFGNGQF